MEAAATVKDSVHIISDHILAGTYERVMPVIDDESVLLAQWVLQRAHGRVLDLGTGSGVLAVAAAKGSEEVIGVDINPKAVRYATASAELNGLGDRCMFLQGDLYGPLEDQSFDVIAVNPPFVPLPFECRMFRSADGGPDGMGVTSRVIEGLRKHLVADGRVLMLTMSLGDRSESLVCRRLKEQFNNRDVRIRTTYIYEQERIEAEPFFELFESISTYESWRRFLRARRLTHLYYMLNEIEPHHRFEHVEERNTIRLKQTEFSGSWEARLNRFRTWLSRKASTGAAESEEPVIRTITLPIAECAGGTSESALAQAGLNAAAPARGV